MSFLDYNFRTEPSVEVPGNGSAIDPRNSTSPVRVIDVILDKHHPNWDTYGGPSSMGAILYRDVNSTSADTKEQETVSEGVAFPLNIGNLTIPLKNEIVLLIDGPGQNADKSSGSLRKYYIDFDEEWKPTRQGVTMALDLTNSKRLFEGLVEILSLAESKAILEDNFKDLLDEIYL